MLVRRDARLSRTAPTFGGKVERAKQHGRSCALAHTQVLPPLSVGKMTLRLYAALNYNQNSARDLRRALNGA